MTTLRVRTITDDRLNLFVGLTNHQLRNALDPERGVVIVESEIAIRVAMQRGLEPLAFLLDERKHAAMQDMLVLAPDEVPCYVLDPDEAQRLTGYRVTRGALAAFRRPVPPPVAELVQGCERLVVLEGITDTSNVGAIFRNAAALGAQGVVVAPTCADPLARRSVRVSMGNVFLVPWARSERPWPDSLMDELKGRGFLRLALALTKDALVLGDQRLHGSGPMVLFFGSEGQGLSPEVLAACDHAVIIPMAQGVDSLNVAASSAVALWELFCRREAS